MKTFNDKEIIMLKEYLQGFLGKPTPFAKQKSIFGSNRFCLWCEEWEIIEMLKYLINGKDNYYRDPPPNRLRDSALLWSKEGIEARVIKDLGNLETVEQMIEYFKNKREHFNEST
jgi:pyruvate-formate lyase-activating enzyme